MKNKVLVVVGPTAVGKTALGIRLCQQFNGQVISGDSQQVYRGLDIGTAKATATEQAAAVHHLLDIRDLNEAFSAFDFVTAANQAISSILALGKIPVIVGGTGLYIQSLIEGYHLGGQENHEEMMALRAELETLSDSELQAQVEKAQIRLEQPNRRRMIRALELAAFGSGQNAGSPYEFYLIGLNAERELLYERINSRVDSMLTQGLLDEAKMLYENYPTAQASRGIGYKEFFAYFAGEILLDEAVELVKRNSRRYAKRQLTWFKNRMAVDFYDVLDEKFPENVMQNVNEFLKK